MENKILEIAKNIKQLTEKTAYKINIESEKPSIFDSKFAGLPYWTKDKEYPTNNDGIPLLLLAQINFDKYEFESPLPSSGMLQFFIESSDLLGLDFDNQTDQNGFRVVYHEKIDYTVSEESIRKLDIPESIEDIDDDDYEDFPIENETKISFSKEIDTINNRVKDFNKYYTKAYNQVYNKQETDDKNLYEEISDDDDTKLNDELNSKFIKHKMLGYPFFTQSDPRDNEKYSEYNILLIQIDSDDSIMWGDLGVCNFFIKEEDLLKKDFSKVLYNWDCY